MNKENLGALIDGIYAIAMTILVLDLPGFEAGQEVGSFIPTFLSAIWDYGLAFILLFAFWCHQRQINNLVEIHSRSTLWFNGMALMTVCLVPFSSSLLYSLGTQPASLEKLNYVLFVDTLFIGLCSLIDFFIHLSLWVIYRYHSHEPQSRRKIAQIIHARRITTCILILVIIVGFILPGSDRRILLAMPLLFVFEKEVVKFWDWLSHKKFGFGV